MENNSIQQNNNDTIDIRELIFKYLKKWYWFVISVFICLFIAFIYIRSTTPKYQVQSTLLLRNSDKSGFDIADLVSFQGTSISASGEVEDEIQVLSSRTIIEQIIHDLELKTEYWEKIGMRYMQKYQNSPVTLQVSEFFNDSIKHPISVEISNTSKGYDIKISSRYENRKKFKKKIKLTNLNDPIDTPFGKLKLVQNKDFENKIKITTYPINTIIQRYKSVLSIGTVNKKSNVISLSITTHNIQKAKDFLNHLVEVYNMDVINDKNMIAHNTAEFIDARLRLLGMELLDEEIKVETYKKDHTLTDISSQAQLYLQASSEYNKRLAEIETQLNLISHIEDHIKKDENKYALIPANIGIEDVSLTTLVQEYNSALLERMKLLRTTQEQNPVIIQLEQQLNIVKTNIISSIQSIKEGLNIALNDVKRKDAQFTSKMKQVPTQERQFLEIKRQQQIKETLYLFLLQKREENALSLASTAPSSKVVDAAYLVEGSASPKIKIIMLAALILGLIIPIVLIFIFDILDNTIKNKIEFTRLVKVPFLGSIAQSKSSDTIVVKEGKTSSVVEMFRMVRTNINFMLNNKKSPVVLITSSVSGEGKTFISINLSMSFALMNKKVIILGLDIRNPMLGNYLQVPKDKGITLYLSDESYTLNDIIIHSNTHPNLDVIPAGPIPPNPAELLLSNRLDSMIEQLKEKYDYIIIDSAPLGIVTDTLLINRIADMSIYVARQDYTTRHACDLINEVYDDKRLNNMSVVLNGTEESASYGQSKYKYTKYQYRYRYNEDDDEKDKKKVFDKIKKNIKK